MYIIVTSFKRQSDVTPSTAITDVTFDLFAVAIDAKAARAFRTVTLLFHITRFFNIGSIGEMCSNKTLRISVLYFILSCLNVANIKYRDQTIGNCTVLCPLKRDVTGTIKCKHSYISLYFTECQKCNGIKISFFFCINYKYTLHQEHKHIYIELRNKSS